MLHLCWRCRVRSNMLKTAGLGLLSAFCRAAVNAAVRAGHFFLGCYSRSPLRQRRAGKRLRAGGRRRARWRAFLPALRCLPPLSRAANVLALRFLGGSGGIPAARGVANTGGDRTCFACYSEWHFCLLLLSIPPPTALTYFCLRYSPFCLAASLEHYGGRAGGAGQATRTRCRVGDGCTLRRLLPAVPTSPASLPSLTSPPACLSCIITFAYCSLQ